MVERYLGEVEVVGSIPAIPIYTNNKVNDNGITAEEALSQLKELYTEPSEWDHMEADRIISQFVLSLGYTEIHQEYERIGKWYA